MTNLNLLRRLLIVSILLSTSGLRYSAARNCFQETCAASGIQDATNFINDLCTGSSAAVSTASSSDKPSATSGVSPNAGAATLKHDMALIGALGALQAVVAII
ncbi:hypothetical protein EDB87DRAFT_1824660 [Lactarius vividus]|nr:hypothetical protein EDB87DRAFT_1824660 [Lactarius vividus]